MAVKVQQVLEILEQIAPPELACSWDNVGLLVDAGRPVTSIMTALDITADVVRDAAESGCELIVSHHPVIFDPLRRVTAEDVPAMLLQNGISAICMHTNLDAAPGGVNDVLADLLRIENRRDFADNCGRIGTLNVPTTAQQLAETCSRMLHTHCKFVEADHPVEKLAEVSGAGGSYLQQAIDEGADCLVTGEAAHHIAILARQKGVGLVVAGHWGTEHPVVFALADALTERLPVDAALCLYAGLREEYAAPDSTRCLATRDIRLARRLVRDCLFRGHGAAFTLGLWGKVCAGEDQYIKPFKPRADLLLDTTHTYEVCLWHALLDTMPPDEDLTATQRRQLDTLRARFAAFPPLDTALVPADSMLREFIGA